MIALGALNPAPFIPWEIMHDLADPIRLNVQLVQVIDHHIGRRALAQHTPVTETGRMSRQGGEPVMGLFQADELFIPNQPAQEVGRKRAAGEELGMRPAVRGSRNGEIRVVNHLRGMLGIKTPVRSQEFDVQITGQRQVEHDIDGVFALFFGNLTDGFAHIGFQVGLIIGGLNDQSGDRTAHAGLNDLQLAVGFFGLALDCGAQGRVFHLGQLVGFGSGRQLAPGRAGIVQIPVFQGERKPRPVRSGLAIDRQVSLPAALQPVQAAAVDFRVLAGRDNDVVQNGSAGGFRQLFQKGQVGLDLSGGLRDLNKSLVSLPQDLGQDQNILVRHDVRHHG